MIFNMQTGQWEDDPNAPGQAYPNVDLASLNKPEPAPQAPKPAPVSLDQFQGQKADWLKNYEKPVGAEPPAPAAATPGLPFPVATAEPAQAVPMGKGPETVRSEWQKVVRTPEEKKAMADLASLSQQEVAQKQKLGEIASKKEEAQIGAAEAYRSGLAEMQIEEERARQRGQAEADKAYQNYATQMEAQKGMKLQDYHSSLTDSQKAWNVVAMAISGLGQMAQAAAGMNTKNSAQEMINKLADDFHRNQLEKISQQKDLVEQARTGYGDARQRLQDQVVAAHARTVGYLQALEAAEKEKLAKAGKGDAEIASNLAVIATQQKLAEEQAKVAMGLRTIARGDRSYTKGGTAMVGGGQGVDKNLALWADGQIVGQIAPGREQTAPQKANETLGGYRTLVGQLEELKSSYEKYGKVAPSIEEAQRRESLKQNLTVALKNSGGLGVLSKDDYNLVYGQLGMSGDYDAWFKLTSPVSALQKTIDLAKKTTTNSLDAYGANGKQALANVDFLDKGVQQQQAAPAAPEGGRMITLRSGERGRLMPDGTFYPEGR